MLQARRRHRSAAGPDERDAERRATGRGTRTAQRDRGEAKRVDERGEIAKLRAGRRTDRPDDSATVGRDATVGSRSASICVQAARLARRRAGSSSAIGTRRHRRGAIGAGAARSRRPPGRRRRDARPRTRRTPRGARRPARCRTATRRRRGTASKSISTIVRPRARSVVERAPSNCSAASSSPNHSRIGRARRGAWGRHRGESLRPARARGRPQRGQFGVGARSA